MKKINIKKLRKQLGLTQVEMAKLLDVTQATISAWENGACPSAIEKLAGELLK